VVAAVWMVIVVDPGPDCEVKLAVASVGSPSTLYVVYGVGPFWPVAVPTNVVLPPGATLFVAGETATVKFTTLKTVAHTWVMGPFVTAILMG
jgi:hypothetical protein